MNVLSISSDRKIFDKNSDVRKRQVSFGYLAKQFHIIIFTKKELNKATEQISRNTWIHPTNSSNRLSYISDAIKIGLRLGKFDLITTQDPFESGWVGYRLSKKLKAKLHVQIHTDFLNKFFIESSLLNKIRVRLAKFILPKADGIRVVSSRIKQSLKQLNLKVDPDIIPVFVDIKKFDVDYTNFNLRKKYPQFEKIILTNSRLEQEKNIRLGILAFKEVLKEYPKTGYLILGDGSSKKDLEDLVRVNNLEKNVTFVGWQNNPLMYYKSSDIYLSTSSYEGYGLSMLEAVFSNLPVVSTDVGIAGDILVNNKNSIICPIGDKECITASLKKLLNDPNLIKSFIDNNKKIVANLIPQFEYAYFENYRKSWLKALGN